jgi:hypothetical protein
MIPIRTPRNIPQSCTQDSLDEFGMNRSGGSQGTKDVYTTSGRIADRRDK